MKNVKSIKGFTLIELLAVIVILGVLLAIAVPAVTKYINSSRKSTFISNVKQYADSARTEALSGAYQFPVSTGQATVIKFSTIYPLLEKGGKTSSYGGVWFKDGVAENSFIMIVNEGTAEAPKYVYYIAAKDDKGYGIGTLADGATTATAGIIEYNQLTDNNVVQLTAGITLPKVNDTIDAIKVNNNAITVTNVF